MEKFCRVCNLILDSTNSIVVKNKYIRSICRKCRSASVVEYDRRRGDDRRKYANEYARRIGRVKEYPCEQCGKLCFKKYGHAFCSDKCRFMFYVDTSGSCWLWAAGVNRSGYGKFSMKGFRNISSHRAAYLLFKGEIPEGKFVCHQCDIPGCVKPAHLWIGTHKENMKDMSNKGRSRNQAKDRKIKEVKTS